MKTLKYIISSVAICLLILVISIINKPTEVKGAVNYQAFPIFSFATSSTYTLTTTSQRLWATSTNQATPLRRISATVQATNCTTGSGPVYLNLRNDKVAVENDGLAVLASTTQTFSDAFVSPVQGSIQGITSKGTCTVLVTQWLSSF